MTRNDSKALRRGRLWSAAGLGLLVVYAGCGLDKVQIPELEGPSELALSLKMTADPDVITADGFSTSLITVTVRDQNGRPVAGRDIFFSIADSSGSFADLGQLLSPTTGVGVGTGVQVRTNAQGIAAVAYEAPARTDATANQSVLVVARPVGNDARTAVYRSVQIELRSAEPRLFAPNPTNKPPLCSFTVQVTGKSTCTSPTSCTIPVGAPVLFQSTAVDPDGTIVRYFWNFGNGKTAESPDSSTVYTIPLVYTVTHIVTDNNGAVAACQATLTVK